MSDSGRQIGDCKHARTPEWCVYCLREEVERLKSGNFTEEEFQNLCHNMTTDDLCRFRKGCEEYQRKLFGDLTKTAPV